MSAYVSLGCVRLGVKLLNCTFNDMRTCRVFLHCGRTILLSNRAASSQRLPNPGPAAVVTMSRDCRMGPVDGAGGEAWVTPPGLEGGFFGEIHSGNWQRHLGEQGPARPGAVAGSGGGTQTPPGEGVGGTPRRHPASVKKGGPPKSFPGRKRGPGRGGVQGQGYGRGAPVEGAMGCRGGGREGGRREGAGRGVGPKGPGPAATPAGQRTRCRRTKPEAVTPEVRGPRGPRATLGRPGLTTAPKEQPRPESRGTFSGQGQPLTLRSSCLMTSGFPPTPALRCACGARMERSFTFGQKSQFQSRSGPPVGLRVGALKGPLRRCDPTGNQPKCYA